VTLRARLTLVATGVVAVVVALVCATTYFVMRHELYSQVDVQLAKHAESPRSNIPDFSAFSGDSVAVVAPDGSSAYNPHNIPIDDSIRTVASGHSGGFFRNSRVLTVEGTMVTLRERVLPYSGGGAVVVARNIDYIDHDLDRLRFILILVSLGGILAAAAAGALVSSTVLAPVRRLTEAAERIAETGEPSERVPEGGHDELAALGRSFNTMLGALEESLEAQRRFVADASHELRTPLTSLQTNIDVLRGDVQLSPEQRRMLLDDLERESQEMRALIGGLLELARGGAQVEKEQFQFDELVEDTLERARSRFPGVSWEPDGLEPTVVDGYRDRMERAVWNLLENAGKWSGEGGSVEISLAEGELQIRDHGPGFADEDRPLVFDRFYRSAAARSMPGSGLGLAIVREVAEAHGGTVTAENAADGGAVVRLSLNGAARPGSAESS
jgi:two-component system, OmpR family, sensor histidine kinase MprB